MRTLIVKDLFTLRLPDNGWMTYQLVKRTPILLGKNRPVQFQIRKEGFAWPNRIKPVVVKECGPELEGEITSLFESLKGRYDGNNNAIVSQLSNRTASRDDLRTLRVSSREGLHSS